MPEKQMSTEQQWAVLEEFYWQQRYSVLTHVGVLVERLASTHGQSPRWAVDWLAERDTSEKRWLELFDNTVDPLVKEMGLDSVFDLYELIGVDPTAAANPL